MKTLSISIFTLFGFVFFLHAQHSRDHFSDPERSNALKSSNGLVYLEDSIHGFNFNAEEVWEGIVKIERSYDERGNLTGSLKKDWDNDAADFLDGYNSSWIYNESNQVEEYFYMKWNPGLLEWDTLTYATYSYDGNGNQTEALIKKRQSNLEVWGNNDLRSYTYDESGNQLEYLSQRWNSDNSVWDDNYLFVYEYNLEDLMSMHTWKRWNSDDSAWRNSEKSIYSYTDGKLMEIDSKWWNNPNEEWYNYGLTEYVYGTNGLRDKRVYQKFDVTDDIYINNNRNLYIYDELGNEIEYHYDTWDVEGAVWKPKNKDLAYYSQHDIANGVIQKLNQAAFIYPNPTENEISVANISEPSIVSIHNINGKLLLVDKVDTNSNSINVSQLPTGLYLIKINNPSGSQVAKFIKR